MPGCPSSRLEFPGGQAGNYGVGRTVLGVSMLSTWALTSWQNLVWFPSSAPGSLGCWVSAVVSSLDTVAEVLVSLLQ